MNGSGLNHLDRIVARARYEAARRREQTPLEPPARPSPRREFRAALRRPGLSLIAEHKRRSPSAGLIREDLALEEVVAAYERGGAAALSVLTEPSEFGGRLEDLASARGASSLPILRKDFIVDRYQVIESVVRGADAILLIVAALGPTELADLLGLAEQLGLGALVEVHDEQELDAAVAAGATLVGINNRNLQTLEVDIRRTFALCERLPSSVTVVAESGFSAPGELEQLEQAGVDAVLIGEALMRSADVEAATRALSRR